MSKFKFIKEIRREIKELNIEIDKLIIKGRSYKHLSKRHKFLTGELRALNNRSIIMPGLVRRIGSFVSTFMF